MLNKEKQLFKSLNQGQTWEAVHFTENTSQLVLHEQNPEKSVSLNYSSTLINNTLFFMYLLNRFFMYLLFII
jgi:hypothetical protein